MNRKYVFTDEQWEDCKINIANQLVELTTPEEEIDFLDTYNDAQDAVQSCVGVDEYYNGEENEIDERSVPKIVNELIECFCPTQDMGEYFEAQSNIKMIVLCAFEEDSKVVDFD